MTQNADCLSELLELERLFQNSDWTFSQNPVKHRAFRITSNDNDRTIWVLLFDRVVNVVRRSVGQFQIEKDKIELLFPKRGECITNSANDHVTQANLLKEESEKILQTLVIVNHEYGRLSGFLFFKDLLIECGLFDAPAPANVNSRNLPTLDEIIDRWYRNSEILCGFLNGQEIRHGISPAQENIYKAFKSTGASYAAAHDVQGNFFEVPRIIKPMTIP